MSETTEKLRRRKRILRGDFSKQESESLTRLRRFLPEWAFCRETMSSKGRRWALEAAEKFSGAPSIPFVQFLSDYLIRRESEFIEFTRLPESKRAFAEQAEIRQINRNTIHRGEHRGIQTTAFKILYGRIANEFRDRDDLWQQIELWSIQAADDYDPTKGMKFSTYLQQSLTFQASNFQQRTWRRSSGNSKCRTITTSPLALDGRQSEDDDSVGMLYTQSDAEKAASVKELLDSLEHRVRSMFQRLLKHPKLDDICAAFSSGHAFSKCEDIAGLSDKQVTQLRSAIRRVYDRHL